MQEDFHREKSELESTVEGLRLIEVELTKRIEDLLAANTSGVREVAKDFSQVQLLKLSGMTDRDENVFLTQLRAILVSELQEAISRHRADWDENGVNIFIDLDFVHSMKDKSILPWKRSFSISMILRASIRTRSNYGGGVSKDTVLSYHNGSFEAKAGKDSIDDFIMAVESAAIDAAKLERFNPRSKHIGLAAQQVSQAVRIADSHACSQTWERLSQQVDAEVMPDQSE